MADGEDEFQLVTKGHSLCAKGHTTISIRVRKFQCCPIAIKTILLAKTFCTKAKEVVSIYVSVSIIIN